MATTTRLDEQTVLAALRKVQDPDLHVDIVSLKFVKDLKISGGDVSFTLELTTPACPVKDQLKAQARQVVSGIEGVATVSVNMTSNVRAAGQAIAQKENLIPGVKNAIAVASGKGGVGKSTVAVNLAIALAKTGATVGLLDADIYGPTVSAMIASQGETPRFDEQKRIVPFERYGVKYMSMGLLAPQEAATIVRGPIAHKLIQQLLGAVAWDELDYLLIDLPPGTGDIHLTITQTIALSGAAIVTTPQDVARTIAGRGLKMLQKMQVPILGVVENMSYYQCDHCSEKSYIFGKGGGQKMAASMGVPFLGEIPIDPAISSGGDAGVPVVQQNPDSPISQAIRHVAGETARWVSIVNEKVSTQITPQEFDKPKGGPLTITWTNGAKTTYPYRYLRAQCPCASCVDENSGHRIISEKDIPEKIELEGIAPVGRYALNFWFDDGHMSGLYPFDYLLRIGK